MASYYTKEVLKERVRQLGEAICHDLKLVGNNKHYAIQYEHGDGYPFAWASWYRSVKELITYIDGAIDGIKYVRQ